MYNARWSGGCDVLGGGMIDLSYQSTAEFCTLLALELILGIDNVIFISLLTKEMPNKMQNTARIFGLSAAVAMRIVMLMGASFVLSLDRSLISLFGVSVSYKHAFMILGGTFLIYKGATEIYQEISSSPLKKTKVHPKSGIISAVGQIILIDLLLSFDSIISAIALTNNVALITLVFILHMTMILLLSKYITHMICKHDRLKTIATLFILVLGIFLTSHGMKIGISHNYLYAIMLFSLTTEVIEMLKLKRQTAKEKYKSTDQMPPHL